MQYRLNRAYTNTATLESRLSGGAGGRSLEQHKEGDAATLEGLGVGIAISLGQEESRPTAWRP